jgi:hypothetical protein
MIPQKKKTPEEIAALREGLGMPPEPTPPPPDQESSAPIVEPIVHLDPPPAPVQPKKVEPKPIHSLRKHDPPLAPAPATTNRTELPTGRHDSRDISQIRKREALAALQQPGMDPVAYLRKQTASPFLYVPGYLLAIAAGIAAYQRFHYITPSVLLAISAFILVFIAWRKPRSRHHAALLFIIVFLTLVFGALHYAPLFKDGP